MHKDFYAGGFLFNPYSERILLQKYSSDSQIASPWLLFGDLCFAQDNPQEIFKNVILELLDIKIDTVYPIYSYSKENIDNNHAIVYSKIKKLQDFPSKNGLTFAWFSFKEMLKLDATEQMK